MNLLSQAKDAVSNTKVSKVFSQPEVMLRKSHMARIDGFHSDVIEF